MANYFGHCMTKEQLEKEHRKLVVKMHPDRNPDNPNATSEFQEMQMQYEERKAELNGDYTKARKGRERREREERERQERERKEQARRKVEQTIEQARQNKQKSHLDLKAGDYIYVRKILQMSQGVDDMRLNDALRRAVEIGVKDETVVKIEAIFDMGDTELMEGYPSDSIDNNIYGGWEVLQKADPANGVYKAKRVAKVVMFRSPHYCFFGNPMGDCVIFDYYVPVNYETMFSDLLHRIRAEVERAEAEKARLEAERKAKILAEQQPLIDEWQEKLIAISAGLTATERQTVAIDNMKKVLKAKFPGTRFSIKTNRYGETSVKWEDGPTEAEVANVTGLFNTWCKPKELTPWQEQFGALMMNYADYDRKMSVLAKAKILQQLGQVTEAFREGAMSDDVTVSEFDWLMLHALVGIDINNTEKSLCSSTDNGDGTRKVSILAAVRYVFLHTSYAKQPKTKKTKAA